MAKNNIHKTEGLRGSDSYHNSINYIYIIHYTLLIYNGLSSCFSLSSVSSANCIIIISFLVRVLQPTPVLRSTRDTQSFQGQLPPSSLMIQDTGNNNFKEAAKENHSNCTKPLNLSISAQFNTWHLLCCPSNYTSNKMCILVQMKLSIWIKQLSLVF